MSSIEGGGKKKGRGKIGGCFNYSLFLEKGEPVIWRGRTAFYLANVKGGGRRRKSFSIAFVRKKRGKRRGRGTRHTKNRERREKNQKKGERSGFLL